MNLPKVQRVISFNLDDMTDGALRKAAVELGIENADGMNKAALIVALKAKLSPDAPLNFGPLASKGDSKGWRSPPVLISMLALVVAVGAACAAWGGTITAINRHTAELEKEHRLLDTELKRTWKAVRVYDIIHRNTMSSERWGGLTFEEIKSKYTEEVMAEKNVALNKDDLQPDELRYIVQELIRQGMIQPTIEDKYAISRHSVPSKDCMTRPSTEAVQNAILKLLSTESGKYNIDKLGTKISDELKIKAEDVYATANCMKSHGAISIDAKGLVWSAIEGPKVEVPAPMPEKK